MIDFTNIEKYKENNRIEAKKAIGGLPRSIWETYSAFANTLGGIILLGVEERGDKSLHPVSLPDPEMLIEDFWSMLRQTNKVSVNILSHKDVTVETIDGKEIVAIRVPRAQRSDKPVYIDGDPLMGSYRRNGEGDYKCTKEEVQAMMRDAAIKTQDMVVLDGMGLDALDYDSVRRYRAHVKACRPGYVWEELEEVEFLYKLGAVGRARDGEMRPTAAGLLMFGYEHEIVKEFPSYFLDYQETFDPDTQAADRVVSSSGDWSGNLYDFYFRVCNKITRGIPVPSRLAGGEGMEDTPIHKALREALANCLINADYYGRQGIVIVKGKNEITLSNPGGFRVDVEAAKNGGVSDPRNGTLVKMFHWIDIGKGTGSGIPNIFSVWKKQGWAAPVIAERFEPDRITMSLSFERKGEPKQATAVEDTKKMTPNVAYREAIVVYLTEAVCANCAELSALIGISSARTGAVLRQMVEENILIAEGDSKNRVYRLKD